jgi:hypothetical protein
MTHVSTHNWAAARHFAAWKLHRHGAAKVLRLAATGAMLILAALPTRAWAEPITIDFENFPSGPSNFGPPPHPVTTAGATFSGGILLTNESASIDLTNVYATVDCCGYSNPLSIAFDSAVANLSVLVTNNVNATYTLADNLGRSVSWSTPAYNVPVTLTLPFEGIMAATITSTGVPGFDFAIDNVSFTAGSAPVPEPGTMVLVGGGIAGMLLRRRERHSAHAQVTPLSIAFRRLLKEQPDGAV